MTRPAYTIDEIKAMLAERAGDVARNYAPRAEGSYHSGHEYWTLNPGRADRRVGSFVVYVSGPKAGRWRDFAMSGTEAHGDMIDLIRLSLGCDLREAIRDARRWLGLDYEAPEDVARRKARAADYAKRQREAAQEEAAKRARRAKAAQALWLSAQPALRGTPAEHYLRQTRGIDLAALGRQPGALRYHPALKYTHVDQDTGEVFEGTYPAICAIINDLRGNVVAVHRTYLAYDPKRATWDKAPVPAPKKVLGDYGGALIQISRGTMDQGPRGGRAPALRDCKPGAHVFITEGIEDALSVCMVLPHVRVGAAISLSNLGQVVLPRAVTRVTLVADRDDNDTARAALTRAIEAHARAGREVRLWQNTHGGKDLNDALRALVRDQERAG